MLIKLDPGFRAESAERLAQAVRIETVSFDEMVGEIPSETDARWRGFLKLREHFESAYPLIHKHLRREVVNLFGLLFTLEGTDPTLKPIILMAHTDTVPVAEETVSQWAHPPFSGFIDGERVWGRGAIDCKDSLTAQLEAMELLLKGGFAPARSVVLAYGFDEEISGHEGAHHLADTLYTRYGHYGAELVLDEGGSRTSSLGVPMAVVGVQEKGYADIKITISAPGGHSSIPPPHTAIGILAEIVSAIESTPYSPALDDSNPLLEMLRCSARWDPNFDPWMKSALRHLDLFRDELVRVMFENPEAKYMITTAQAVDVVLGGTKVNALPESAHIKINHRIAVHQTISDIESHLLHLLLPIADRHALSVISRRFGHAPEQVRPAQSAWAVEIETLEGIEPAPRSPAGEGSSVAWDRLAGTVRHVFGEEVVVTPILMPANTDTKFYWGVTPNVLRFVVGAAFTPINGDHAEQIHTVNESIYIDDHVASIAFYHEFIRNLADA
ncbi:carboxypeptidase S [Blyttiomyces helicus]|uniref:Carboxypeptidase S n=1 Tax=Blyttiomyces helicus TaxID=388810 RepID=A0A4P9WDN0_9FUNG|nr:carboxypeptidase S [Blyttiomyces helicus]|eukprot:RKO88466.1 carboxypeptidase S [Blyttiomyces helicus]